MIALTKPSNEVQRQWRRQVLAHGNPQHVAARKGFVAMAFVDQANTSSRFIEINDLLVLLVHEDDAHCHDRRSLRLSGYKVNRTPGGVQWGGAENCRVFKDLTLAPQYEARGQRIDRSKYDLLAMALKLDRRLSRAARHSAAPWPGLHLPRLWSGFGRRQAANLRGRGPEFEEACSQQGRAADELFRKTSQQIAGLTAVPLDWVSDHTDSAVAIFVEVTPSLRRQVCRIDRLPDGLIDYQGASAFDFYNSQFRRTPRPSNGRYKPVKSDGPIRSQTFPIVDTTADCATPGAVDIHSQLSRWADQIVSA